MLVSTEVSCRLRSLPETQVDSTNPCTPPAGPAQLLPPRSCRIPAAKQRLTSHFGGFRRMQQACPRLLRCCPGCQRGLSLRTERLQDEMGIPDLSARQEGAARLGTSLRVPEHQNPMRRSYAIKRRASGTEHAANNKQACSDDPRPVIPERRSRRRRALLRMEGLAGAYCQNITASGCKIPLRSNVSCNIYAPKTLQLSSQLQTDSEGDAQTWPSRSWRHVTDSRGPCHVLLLVLVKGLVKERFQILTDDHVFQGNGK